MRTARTIKTKRIYAVSAQNDGYRVLVDRLWPRGTSREKAGIDLWLKNVAPSEELRKWFNHEPEKWGEFKRKYFSELDNKKETLKPIINKLREGITLLYSAKDEDHNNAVALKEYLENKTEVNDETNMD